MALQKAQSAVALGSMHIMLVSTARFDIKFGGFASFALMTRPDCTLHIRAVDTSTVFRTAGDRHLQIVAVLFCGTLRGNWLNLLSPDSVSKAKGQRSLTGRSLLGTPDLSDIGLRPAIRA